MIEGDAVLSFDSSDNTMDVTFDNITDVDDSNRTHDDITFRDVPVDSNGRIGGQSHGSRWLQGGIGGPGDSEVVGTFVDPVERVSGAFGARKQ